MWSYPTSRSFIDSDLDSLKPILCSLLPCPRGPPPIFNRVETSQTLLGTRLLVHASGQDSLISSRRLLGNFKSKPRPHDRPACRTFKGSAWFCRDHGQPQAARGHQDAIETFSRGHLHHLRRSRGPEGLLNPAGERLSLYVVVSMKRTSLTMGIGSDMFSRSLYEPLDL